MAAKLHLNQPQDLWSFGQVRSKWRCLAVMHSTTSGKNETWHIITSTSQKCMVMDAASFGFVLELQKLGNLQSLSQPTPLTVKAKLKLTRALIPNREANLQQED